MLRVVLLCTAASLPRADTVTEPLRTFGYGALSTLAVSADGQHFVTGGDRGVFLWEIESGKAVRLFEGQVDRGLGIARPWNVRTRQLIRAFEDHNGAIRSVAFSPDGQQALTGSDDRTATLWDVQTGRLLRRFEGHTESIFSVAFSPDGQRVLTGSWDKIHDAQRGARWNATVAWNVPPPLLAI